jgi:membrane protease YdiL (CAAX protease family)
MEAAERGVVTDWPPWTAPVALIGGLLLAAVGGLLVDLPAAAFGVNVTSSHIPGGLEIVDTVVQDIVFVGVAVYCAHLGARTVRSWQFGLRRPGVGWRSAGGLILLLLVAFIVLSAIWSAVVHPETEKLLETLGSNEGATLLLLSAALTCIVAPICEEFLFRGFIFGALRNWRGPVVGALITGLLFGAIHVGSAPVVDLVPLALLGVLLCGLRQLTGSIYPGIALHSLNNAVALVVNADWSFAAFVAVLIGSFALITLLLMLGQRSLRLRLV